MEEAVFGGNKSEPILCVYVCVCVHLFVAPLVLKDKPWLMEVKDMPEERLPKYKHLPKCTTAAQEPGGWLAGQLLSMMAGSQCWLRLNAGWL